ncbi:LUZP4 isoform 2 [Pongo abelii]|uniref:LUZP4 isoform 2 n=1 Tax=Pongo abelii TaxID=9601 RepID=A0A2J8VAA6_PONAB|nr:LUZP4 isoform 2 [Pongo abelii]
MASFQKLTLSEKVLPNHASRKKVNFLDMSLDDIIIYKELEGTNAEEEEKNKRQNHSKKESSSRQQSNAHRHHHRRGEVQ